MIGIGGGGDVVGALAVARLCESLGTPFVLGGVAWERLPIDPHPGPRSASEIEGGRALGGGAILASPETSTPEGVRFSESRMAAHLSAETVLIDVSGGAAGAAEGIAAALRELDCDLLVGLDVGGDVLARGDEAELASPLCDAVMVAAALRAGDESRPLLAVIGPGCDGELRPAEVLARVADLARAGAWLGAWGVTPEAADELEAAAAAVPTEASLQVARCARGEIGEAEIRRGRRRVELGPVGALAFFFDADAALAELPLARAVSESASIEEARAALAARGIRTELDYERERSLSA
ncbi:MAG TPA: DUF1152 domain-containing protein [Solirubrobacterales bacterium]|nr:DUF1152 domain-containing protein [Solirubrobacterales bacterium]